MKKYALLFAICIFYCGVGLAKTTDLKQIIHTINNSLKQNQTSESPDLLQKIDNVKGHYNPFTGTSFIINFAKINRKEQLNKQLLSLASEEKRTSFEQIQQEAKSLSHHIYQLERKIKAIENTHNNAQQLNDARNQLNELTLSKAKINNQYRRTKMDVLDEVISTNTLHTLQRQLSASVCHMNENEKRSLKTLTLILIGIQNGQHEITWHFPDLLACLDNSLAEQEKFSGTKQTSVF